MPTTTTMRAFTLGAIGTAPAVRDVPTPTPAAGEVLVRVRASSVNPVDAGIASGMLAQMFEYRPPVTIGRDYAGTVEQVGEGVTRYAAGDEVYGFVPMADPIVHAGSWAELIAVPAETSTARAPGSVDLGAAGAAPLAGITAMLAVDALALSEGDSLLVVGATGGVGSLAVQLAARAGATVIAPALREDAEYLRALGVTEVLGREGDVAAAVRDRFPDGVDALLDVVSYAPGAYDAALKPGARVASPNGAAGDGAGRTDLMALSTTENLERLAQLLDAGAMKVPVHESYELDRAAEALHALGGTHTQGKLAIRVA
jgi:NADPH:quinone reductase-like Zn-dependent oxidoreductase